MGLFKDFKEDFSQAVNEMMPGGEDPTLRETEDALVVDTLSEDVDVQSELTKLDGLLDGTGTQTAAQPRQNVPNFADMQHPAAGARRTGAPRANTVNAVHEEKNTMSDTIRGAAGIPNNQISDEITVITASTVMTGDLTSAGSFDIQGTINGNVSCSGKMSVTGTINGNSSSSEFFADVAKIEGEVVTTGTAKIGAGSVIIGNITAASAVIAGAVKGDIDVQGPVVVDTSAVIMGNIKSRSVQINNGAVIEGFCSQCYADIDVEGLFEGR